MPWYFLPKEYVKPETDVILANSSIPTAPLRVAQPIAEEGLVFCVPQEHLVAALDAIGLSYLIFTPQPTEQEGILFLLASGGSLPPVGQPAGRAVSSPEVFADYVRQQDEAVRRANEAALGELRKEVARLEGELFRAARRYADTEEQLAVSAADEAGFIEHLKGDFTAIGKDNRVAGVSATPVHLIVETKALVLAAKPARFLGRFRIAVGLTDSSLRVEAIDKPATTEYPHPKVSVKGIPYLGGLREALIRRLSRYEFATTVRMLLDFLEEPPIGEIIPEMSPSLWPELPRSFPPSTAATVSAPAPPAPKEGEPVLAVVVPATGST